MYIADQARDDQVQLFLTESCMMKGQVNPNIYPIIGSCVGDGEPPFIIYPDATVGNLKKFLLHCRVSDTGTHCVSYVVNSEISLQSAWLCKLDGIWSQWKRAFVII